MPRGFMVPRFCVKICVHRQLIEHWDHLSFILFFKDEEKYTPFPVHLAQSNLEFAGWSGVISSVVDYRFCALKKWNKSLGFSGRWFLLQWKVINSPRCACCRECWRSRNTNDTVVLLYEYK